MTCNQRRRETDFFKIFNSLFINRIFKDPWQSTSMCGRWLKDKASLAVPVFYMHTHAPQKTQ